MPPKCPVCSKFLYSYQNRIQCGTCFGWVHHGNRLKCSSLTDSEFQEHVDDIYKPFECDHCVSELISKNNNSVFQSLPFPVECEENIFGKPTEIKRKPDISTMTTSELNKFVKQCQNIKKQFNPSVDIEEEDEFFNSMIDSDYYSINKFNKLKPDKTYSFGVAP